MAWRTKSVLSLCIIFCALIILVQEFVYSSWDFKRNAHKKIIQWPVNLQVSRNITQTIVSRDLSELKHNNDVTYPHHGIGSFNSSQKTSKSINKDGGAYYSNSYDITPVPDVTTATIGQQHDRRIRTLENACKSSSETRLTEPRKANHTEFFYSRSLRFAYCKVPKSGSTFWMNVFMILARGGDISRLISLMSRGEIHDRTRKFIVDPRKIFNDHVRTVVVARNPYTRLYSAYIDKVYLPLFWEHFETLEGARVLPEFHFQSSKNFLKTARGMVAGNSRLLRYRDKLLEHGILVKKNVTVKVKPICVNHASFEQFLKFIIDQVKLKKPLEPHWAPISHLCRPCKLNTFKVVKQETFSADVEHTLTAVGMNLSKYDWLQKSLNENRIESSVPGIVAVVAHRLQQKQVKMCISDLEVIQRLWHSFQIQGFISDQSSIPEVFLKPYFRFDKREVTKQILAVISENPLTSEERVAQRHRHFTRSINSVSTSVLQEIQDIYQLDFSLFDYPILPPLDG